jgi:hypothetical protein
MSKPHTWNQFEIGLGLGEGPTLFPTGPVKVFSALADWFLYLKPIPRAWFTYHPDDGGSKDLWNVGKLLQTT